MKNKFVIGVHIFILILAWCSWLVFDWKIIVIGIILYHIQLKVVGTCILTKKQFKNKSNETFYSFILSKLGIKVNPQRFEIITDYVFPIIIFALSIIWQISLNHTPPLNIIF